MSKRGPLVSVIIPSNRHADILERAITSICKQTYDQIEMIVVSVELNSDAPERVYRSARSRLVEVCDNLSLGELRNIACRQSRGSIIVVADDDDISAPTRIERIVAALENSDVCGSSLVRLEDKARNKAYEWDGENLPKEEVARLYGATLAFRRETWEYVNFNPYMHIGEDFEWLRRVIDSSGDVFDFRDATMTTHSINDTNASPKRPRPPCWREIGAIDAR